MTFARTISLTAVAVSLAGAAFGINAATNSVAGNQSGKPAVSCGQCATCCQAAGSKPCEQSKATKPCCGETAAKSSKCAECAAANAKNAKPGECATCADAARAKAQPALCPECSENAATGAELSLCTECTAEAARQEKPDGETVAEAAPHGPEFMRGRSQGFGRGRGFGPGGRFGFGSGAGQDDQFATDHDVFFFLLDHRDAITRKVTNLSDGIETLTESDNPEVAAKIQEHVAAMYERVENGRPIHMRDPLFREIFANAEKIRMKMTETEHGVLVRETSDDPYVARLLHEHGKVVSLFLKNGRSELPRNHEVPPRRAAANDQ
jgi:hypothetical protein